MAAHGCLRGLSNGRQYLLNAARGLNTTLTNEGYRNSAPSRILRCFPLTEKNVRTPALSTPHDFHTTLCQLITSAKRRVYLASLYIGPGANPSSSHKELELLTALRSTAATQVKILLDKNRALRPVPVITDHPEKTTSTISSAEACFQALEDKIGRTNDTSASLSTNDHNNSGIYLFSVLPQLQQLLLPNPYNEVAGVFHLKCYIIDNDIILTGANLSEEYFCDRIDRYLWLTTAEDVRQQLNTKYDNPSKKHDNSDNLVEFYIKLIDNLCQHAEPFTSTSTSKSFHYPTRTSKKELLDNLVNLLTIDPSNETNDTRADSNLIDETYSSRLDEEDIVAYVVPTFQAPSSYLRNFHKTIPSDTLVVANLIDAVSELSKHNTRSHTFQIRLASAYLNLTDHMIETMGKCHTAGIHLLTAGYVSHGFKPNTKKIGNKGKSWIPAVFDALGRQCIASLQQKQLDSFGIDSDQSTKMWYFQREGWTFHAKGMWFTTNVVSSDKLENAAKVTGDKCLDIDDTTSLCAAIHGSGNYGERSAGCDMESNLILVFTDSATNSDYNPNVLQRMLQADWNFMCNYARSFESEKVQPLSFSFRIVLPLIRPFF